MDTENRQIYTVSQVNELVKKLIETAPSLSNVYLRGEISNFTNHRTGHFYFSLKDEGGLIRAIMFRSSASKLKFVPEDGMKILARGRIACYPKEGQYQFYAEEMEPDGVGALYIAFEQLKKRLAAEGLFDPAHKKPLPKIPRRIGIITSPTGAAIRDMIHVTGRRFPYAELILYPALVQGDGAAPQLIEGLRCFNTKVPVDVIILGRGGGSMEDLWAFNEESLARAVYASKVPIISAVGHETDFTICDFVADRRAPTPSAAAEIAVPQTAELEQKFLNITARFLQYLNSQITILRQRVEQCAKSPALASPTRYLDEKRTEVFGLARQLDHTMRLRLGEKQTVFAAYTAKLEALNPMAVISRGYAAVFDASKTLLKSIRQVKPGETVSLQLSDGTVHATVDSVQARKE